MSVEQAQAMDVSDAAGRRAHAEPRASRSRWRRLAESPFEIGQHDYVTFAVQANPHDMLIDRLGGPIGIQIGLLVVLLTLAGHNDPSEVRVGLLVAAGAVLAGVVLVFWGRLLSLRVISIGPVFAAVLIVIAGCWGGELALAVPELAVVVGTAVFAQRPWRLSLAFAALLSVAYAIVLRATDPGPAPVTRWVIVTAAIVSSGAFVHWIRRQVLEVVDADLEARRRAEGAARELAIISQTRSEFLARMSHHLRTPLNAVLGFTSILQSGRSGPLSDRQAEYLEDVRSAGLHLVDLVDELFDLARIEAGNPRLELTPLDVRHTVDECVRLVGERATRAGVTLEATVDPAVPRVLADPLRIRQVLLNLMANAVRFTPSGGSVRIRAWSDEDRVFVAVRDTGVGIAPADQQRMFDRFEQVAGSSGGTGLGLSLARRFVEQHGGQITVSSQPDRGAVFTFWLPMRPVPPAAETDGPVAAPSEAGLYSALIEPGTRANRALIAAVGRWVSLEAAGLALVLALITPGSVVTRAVIAGFALAALLVMVSLPRFTERAPLVGLDLIAVFGIAGISGIALVSGSFSELAGLGYAWLIMTAFAPWARGSGFWEVGIVAVTYALVLAVTAGPGSELAQWIAVVGLLTLNGLTVRSLVQKLRLMVFTEREGRLKAEAMEEELRRAASHKDDFVGSMSHELRTPLHAVIGFSDVLVAGAGGDLNDQQRAHLDEVRSAGRELLGLIDDILTLAKLEAQSPRLVRSPVPLGTLIARAIDAEIAERVEVQLPHEAMAVSVDADGALVERALGKLLRNAIAASPPDEPVELRVRADDGMAIVQVRDSGPGLPADVSGRLAIPFARVDDLKGPFLGLSLAHRVAAAHGGELTYERGPGTTTFTLRIPEAVG